MSNEGRRVMGIDELRKLAEAATPGPFDIERREEDCGYFRYIVHGAKGDVAWCNEDLDPNARRHAQFLAAFDRDEVLKLLAVVEAAKETRAAAKSMAVDRFVWQLKAIDRLDAALAALEGEKGGDS